MSLLRLIDAACNRACEGIRTLEDLARFVLDDAAATASLKHLRHDLRRKVTETWADSRLVWSRNTTGDIGTSVQTTSERVRNGLGDVAAAAGRRAAEAMRTLEEVSKLSAPDAAEAIESLRYGLYELAGTVERRLGGGPAPQWRLCLLLTQAACKRSWQEVLAGAVSGGVDVVQVREKAMGDADLLQHTRAVMEACGDIPVIINDRVDIALAAGAAGVHVGQDDLSVHDVRRQCGHHLVVGVSTHGPAEVAAAVEAGADYVGVGPIFASSTRPDLQSAGIERIRESLPIMGRLTHLAIGGLTPDNIAEVVQSGARGIAVGQAICGADDPSAVARACASVWDGIPA